MIDEQDVFRALLYRARDPLSMLRAEEERAENQDVEGSLEQCELLAFGSGSGFHVTQACLCLGLDVNQSRDLCSSNRDPAIRSIRVRPRRSVGLCPCSSVANVRVAVPIAGRLSGFVRGSRCCTLCHGSDTSRRCDHGT